MKNQIKAVIFDWGGVLIHNPTDKMRSYLAKQLNVDKAKLVIGISKFLDDFQKGSPENSFWERVCSELGVQKPEKPMWEEAFKHAYRENRKVFALASALKSQGFKIGFLSNTEIPTMGFFFKRNYDLFDGMVFSCAVGRVKPEKEIYLMILERLGVRPLEAVFIDDRKEFTEGAERLGINPVLYSNPQQLTADLRLLGIRV